MAVFGDSGGSAITTAVFFKSYVKFMSREDFLIFLPYSDIKTKPNNHGLHESCKTSPLLSNYNFRKASLA